MWRRPGFVLLVAVHLAAIAVTAIWLPVRWGFVAVVLPIAVVAAIIEPVNTGAHHLRKPVSLLVYLGGLYGAGMVFYGDQWLTWPGGIQTVALASLCYALLISTPFMARRRAASREWSVLPPSV